MEISDAVKTLASPDARLGTSHSAGLRTPGLLGQRPLIGLMMVLLGGILFGVLAVAVKTHGPLLSADAQYAANLHDSAMHTSVFFRGVMIFGFYAGEHVILLMGLVLAGYFLHKRFWPELAMVLIAWIGEAAIWVVLTGYFSRPRPVFDTPVWHQMTSPSFPSGHACSAVLCFGLLAYLLVPKTPTLLGKAAVIVAAVLTMLYIGFSRVYVGDHYPIDVLAGYALGIAGAGLVYTTIELIARRRGAR